MEATSWYVESGAMENTGLDRRTRFPTREEAAQALAVLTDAYGPKDRNGRAPTVEESREPANSTFAEWNAKGW